MRGTSIGSSLVACVAFLGLTTTAAADGGGELWVRGLRVEPLTLLTCDDELRKAGEATRADLEQPWPAQQDEVRPDILRVTVKQRVYCVKAFSVETNRPVAAYPQQGNKACGPKDQSRGMGGTRNLGKECKK